MTKFVSTSSKLVLHIKYYFSVPTGTRFPMAFQWWATMRKSYQVRQLWMRPSNLFHIWLKMDLRSVVTDYMVIGMEKIQPVPGSDCTKSFRLGIIGTRTVQLSRIARIYWRTLIKSLYAVWVAKSSSYIGKWYSVLYAGGKSGFRVWFWRNL